MKIGKYEFIHPIIQAGMGVGITLTKMAIASSKNGVVPVVALVGTSYRYDEKIPKAKDFTSKESMKKILDEIRAEVGDAPIFCNIMVALSEYETIVKNAIEVGFNGIISGAGLPLELPGLLMNHKDIAMIPIVNHRAYPILLRQWKKKYDKDILPDAVILEGPLSGGHQGYKAEELFNPEIQLEATTPKVLAQIKKTGVNTPLFVAGGIMTRSDVKKFINLGCEGVQVGTRFLMTHESDASGKHKQMIIDSKKDDIIIGKSPAKYPCRKLKPHDTSNIGKIKCVSNCLTACDHGKEANVLGFCIANDLGNSHHGKENGLYFVGARGHELKEIISVAELVKELTTDG